MALTAYLPLAQVYDFHATAERWILRRYAPQVTAQAGAERRRGEWAESVIDVFPDRSGRKSTQTDGGQANPDVRTIYTRTPIRLTDTPPNNVQPSDVLFDPHGGAWQASNAGEWQEALGYAVVLTRAGVRGRAPW